jgi:hypothetical protein
MIREGGLLKLYPNGVVETIDWIQFGNQSIRGFAVKCHAPLPHIKSLLLISSAPAHRVLLDGVFLENIVQSAGAVEGTVRLTFQQPLVLKTSFSLGVTASEGTFGGVLGERDGADLGHGIHATPRTVRRARRCDWEFLFLNQVFLKKGRESLSSKRVLHSSHA